MLEKPLDLKNLLESQFPDMWPPTNRPFSVTILAVLALMFAASSAIRFGAAISFWETLQAYQIRPGVFYIAISGAIWCIIGLSIFIGLFWGRTWARKACIVIIPAYTTWYWLDRLTLHTGQTNWAFALLITAGLLSFSIITLFLKGNIQYFTPREIHDQESKN